MNHEPFVAFIRELAEASARVILPYYGSRDMGMELKSDASPVTLADRGAEKVMREMIAQRFPEHGIVGEEFGTERGDAEYVWVLDPVDGNKSFISGVPLFGPLLGLLHRGQSFLGLVLFHWVGLGGCFFLLLRRPRCCPGRRRLFLCDWRPDRLFRGHARSGP